MTTDKTPQETMMKAVVDSNIRGAKAIERLAAALESIATDFHHDCVAQRKIDSKRKSANDALNKLLRQVSPYILKMVKEATQPRRHISPIPIRVSRKQMRNWPPPPMRPRSAPPATP